MAGERIKLEVQERESRGSAQARRLRSQGLVPGVLYGRGKPPHAFCVHQRELRRALGGPGGLHAILDVVLEGQKTTHASILKDYQQDPIRGHISHVDLHEVRLDQPIQTTVALHLVGEAAGSKEGGVLSQSLNELNIEALPLEIPPGIEIDVSELHIGDNLRVSDIKVPEGVTLLDDPETTIASVTQPTRVEEPAEGEEGAEAAEGAEQPEGAAEAPAEPGADAAGEEQTVEG
jgi:large subunit ribosomal protein L25